MNEQHSCLKFSVMILYLSSNQNKLTMLLPLQPKEQYISFNVATEAAIIARDNNLENVL